MWTLAEKRLAYAGCILGACHTPSVVVGEERSFEVKNGLGLFILSQWYLSDSEKDVQPAC